MMKTNVLTLWERLQSFGLVGWQFACRRRNYILAGFIVSYPIIYGLWTHFKRLPTVPVDVSWVSPSDAADNYKKLIIKELEQRGLKLRLTGISSDGEERVKPVKPVLVVAPSVTRLAIDVDHATKNINYSSLVMVMILHNRAPHVEESLPDSQVMLTTSDKKYSELGLIVDLIVYDNYLSSCVTNQKSLTRVAEHLKDYVRVKKEL